MSDGCITAADAASIPAGDVAATVAHLRAILDPKTRPADPKIEAISPGHLKHAETVRCADGFSMSVQASRFHYCSPRESHGGWYEVEVGFPSAKVEAFMPYIDGSDVDPTETVYGYVPLEIVAQAVIDHGGIKATAASSVGTAEAVNPDPLSDKLGAA